MKKIETYSYTHRPTDTDFIVRRFGHKELVARHIREDGWKFSVALVGVNKFTWFLEYIPEDLSVIQRFHSAKLMGYKERSKLDDAIHDMFEYARRAIK